MTASPQGIFITILVLGILITVHELGHFLAAKSLKVPVRQFAIGFGPRIFGFVWGETECRLNWIPLGGYCAFEDDIAVQNGPTESGGKADDTPSNPRLLRNRPIWQRTWVISAGVIFNFVFAWLLLFGSVLALGVPTGNQLVYVQQPMPGTPAAAAGLRPGDQIVAIQNAPFKDFQSFGARLGELKQQPITLDVVRDGKPLELSVTPTAEGKLGFKPLIQEEKRTEHNPLMAGVAAWDRQAKITGELWSALGQIFSKPDQIAGPVAIVAFGDQIFQMDPWRLIDFAVLLSIELAIINILPLPALDGGHLVMLIAEKLRGKPLPKRLEEGILMSGFVLIMGLGMVLIFRDVLFTVPGMYK